MTLNITALTPLGVFQVSDRRMTHLWRDGRSYWVDNLNKSLVLACADGLFCITFTGIAQIGAQRIDDWLVETLAARGAAERSCDFAAETIAEAATELFRSVDPKWEGEHVFTIAGWEKATANPSIWFIGNGKPPNQRTFVVRRISTRRANQAAFFVTGWRQEKRILLRALRTSKSWEEIQTSLVSALRAAAENPGPKFISKDCMAVAISKDSEVVARFYSMNSVSKTLSPDFVWFAGGRNVSLKGMEFTQDGNYTLFLGGTDVRFLVEPPMNLGAVTAEPGFESKAWVRFDQAVYRDDPLTDIEFVRITENDAKPAPTD